MLLSATFVLVSSAIHACTVSVHVMVTHAKHDYAMHANNRTIDATDAISTRPRPFYGMSFACAKGNTLCVNLDLSTQTYDNL